MFPRCIVWLSSGKARGLSDDVTSLSNHLASAEFNATCSLSPLLGMPALSIKQSMIDRAKRILEDCQKRGFTWDVLPARPMLSLCMFACFDLTYSTVIRKDD